MKVYNALSTVGTYYMFGKCYFLSFSLLWLFMLLFMKDPQDIVEKQSQLPSPHVSVM